MQTLQRTNDNFTIGIVNLPIILENGRPLKYLDTKTNKTKYEVVPNMRYPFFEIDTQDPKIFDRVLRSYADLKLPVYAHKTMRGYHFLSVVAMQKNDYQEWIKPLMKLNPKCPMVTLRIKPNKWTEEKKVWNEGTIISNGASDLAVSQLETLRQWIQLQFIGLLQLKFYIVRYRMTGEMGNL